MEFLSIFFSSGPKPVMRVPGAGGEAGEAGAEKYDAEMFLDKSYRKHLDRHNNKFLLRVRMLFYIHYEILGEFKSQINKHTTARYFSLHATSDRLNLIYFSIQNQNALNVISKLTFYVSELQHQRAVPRILIEFQEVATSPNY